MKKNEGTKASEKNVTVEAEKLNKASRVHVTKRRDEQEEIENGAVE